MERLYQCSRCRYHYGPQQLGFEPGQLFPRCNDRAGCDRRLALRKKDREAVRGKR